MSQKHLLSGCSGGFETADNSGHFTQLSVLEEGSGTLKTKLGLMFLFFIGRLCVSSLKRQLLNEVIKILEALGGERTFILKSMCVASAQPR